MATVIKKISELEQLTDLSSSANVIIEENGKAKRFSAQNIGKVKTVNGIEPDENGNVEVSAGSGGNACGISVQPDWNQNDETAADYVKNRPFFKTEEEIFLLPESQFEGTQTEIVDSSISELTAGKEYTVRFDNEEYVCVAQTVDLEGNSLVMVGNTAPFGGEGGDEPFVIILATGAAMVMALTEGSHAVSVVGTGTTYKKIDPNYYICVGNPGDGYLSEVFNHPENVASGNGSHAEGWNTTASGDSSHTEGDKTTGSGKHSHAEGCGTVASGDYGSHAEGWNTTASGEGSHAEGVNTTASGDDSHAEGLQTTASGQASHVEGFNAVASGYISHAEGNGTIAASSYQHVQGRYNVEDNEGKFAHIVGNGTSDDTRANAHTVDWNGNGWFYGTVEVRAVILKSPNGIRYKVTVSDDGALSASAIAE